MTILAVRTFNDPILRKKAQKIAAITPHIKKLAQDMLETMYLSKGIGLAGPQVGISESIITIDISQDGESLNPMPLINPEIIKTRGQCEYEEGCLSVPGFRGSIVRPEQITVRYSTLEGEVMTLPVKGLLARVIQHEMDHLNGILFTDFLDQNWWDSEEGKQMELDHPKFMRETQYRVEKNKQPITQSK
ncbi:peptide deformylase [candidate division CSSED10-310 bacterium]|uniref:Peptide deformylase n=1 Tax=candidate division CSSED10-310 bacterium TaxID=2855610 RepID=A0ABV6YTT9_UNCC1